MLCIYIYIYIYLYIYIYIYIYVLCIYVYIYVMWLSKLIMIFIEVIFEYTFIINQESILCYNNYLNLLN